MYVHVYQGKRDGNLGRQNRTGTLLPCQYSVTERLFRRQKYIFRALTGRHKETRAAYRIWQWGAVGETQAESSFLIAHHSTIPVCSHSTELTFMLEMEYSKTTILKCSLGPQSLSSVQFNN